MTVILGSTSTGGSNDTGLQGIIASRYVASATGSIDTVSISVTATNEATASTVGIYTDYNNGTFQQPHLLVGNAVALTMASNPGVPTVYTSASGIAAAITSGVNYWIAFLQPDTSNIVFTFSSTATTNSVYVSGASSLPGTFAAATQFSTATELIDAYGSGTISGGTLSIGSGGTVAETTATGESTQAPFPSPVRVVN